jgi:putative ABC transport system permease protein
MFSGADRPDARRVAVVSQTAADELFHGDAVGRTIEDSAGRSAEIVGVVAARPTGGRSRPTIFFYGQQVGRASERTEPATFRVPEIQNMPRAVLAGNIVSASYFDAVGMSRVTGETFADGSRSCGCRVAIVNQDAAELFFGGDAVGGAVIDAAGRRTEIVGVVESALLRSSQRVDEPTIYFPMDQDFRPRMTLVLQADKASARLLKSVQSQLEAVPGGDPAKLVVTSLDEHLGRTALASERIAALLLGACATIALALGVLGLYGALGDAVRHRRREIAVRLALGARRWRIMRQLLIDGLRLACAGLVAGAIGALLVRQWLVTETPGMGSPTVWVWLAPPVALLAAVAIASVLPVRRALTVNPVTLLQRN